MMMAAELVSVQYECKLEDGLRLATDRGPGKRVCEMEAASIVVAVAVVVVAAVVGQAAAVAAGTIRIGPTSRVGRP